MGGMNDFAPHLKKNGCFIVRNVTPDRGKTLQIFKYPILFNQTRDILQIPGVSEADIRASLLKGELRHKILAKDIIIECSDIDLLQFNDDQKDFLESAGVMKGLEVTSTVGTLNYAFREKIPLIGTRNGSNRTFYTPEKFINGFYFGNIFHITVEHNGKELYENIDFTISESSGPGTGYDTLNIISLTPNVHSLLYASFAIKV